MKHFLSFALVLLSLCAYSQDTLIRSFNATVAFSGFTLTNTGRYAGVLSVNDQTGTYYADSVKVNDYVFASNGTLYVIDTVGSATLFSVPVTIRRLSGQNVAPIGIGDVFRPTKNYGLFTFTPDNQNGISSQAQAIKLSGAIHRVDSIAKDISTKTGGVISPGSQSAGQVAYFSGNDTLAGSNNLFYDASNIRLGIGTNTPTHRIEIESNSTSALKFNHTGSQGAGTLLFANNDTTIWSVGASGLKDFQVYNYTDSTASIHVSKTNNKVGIRNGTPSEALHVKGKIRADTLSSTLNFLVSADSSGVLGRVAPNVLLDSLYRTITYTYWSSTGSDLDQAKTDSIIARAKVHAWTLRAESGAISNVIATFNNPLDADLGKMIVITAEDESSSYSVQLSSVLLYGLLEASYNMIDDQSITLSAQKTSSGNRWVIVSNSVDVIDPNTYATRSYVNNLLSRDTITSGTLTSGSVTVRYSLFGSGTPTLTSPTTGTYTFTMPANTDFRSLVVTGNTNNLDGALAFTFAVNNTANASDQFFNVQLYAVSTNGLIDQHATSTNHTQTVSSNTTTMVFPGMGYFGLQGFRIILR